MAGWLQDDDEKLRALAITGLSAAQIAQRMLRPKASVRGRAAKLGIVIARDAHAMKKQKFILARRNSTRINPE
jgi:hypothetical protein